MGEITLLPKSVAVIFRSLKVLEHCNLAKDPLALPLHDQRLWNLEYVEGESKSTVTYMSFHKIHLESYWSF